MEYKLENDRANMDQETKLLKEQLKNQLIGSISRQEEFLEKSKKEVDNVLSHPYQYTNSWVKKPVLVLKIFQRELVIKQLILCMKLLEESAHYVDFFLKSSITCRNDHLYNLERIVHDIKETKNVIDLLLQNGIESLETVQKIFSAINPPAKEALDSAAKYSKLPLENVIINQVILKILLNRFAYLITQSYINIQWNEITPKPTEILLFEELKNLVKINNQWVVKLEEGFEGRITKEELYRYVDNLPNETIEQNFSFKG